MISLEGLDKANVLASLYNASRPLGMGFLQYDPAPMSREEAAKEIALHTFVNMIGEDKIYFDYLRGRVMKVDLTGDELDPRLYDRDNGAGAAAKAVDLLR